MHDVHVVLTIAMLGMSACSASGTPLSSEPSESSDGAMSIADAAEPSFDFGRDAAQANGACALGAPCGTKLSCYSDDGTAYVQCTVCTSQGTWDGCLTVVPTPPAQNCASGQACSGAATCAYEDLKIAVYCRCMAGIFDCQTQPLAASCSTTVQNCQFSAMNQGDRTWWTTCASVQDTFTFSTANVQVCEKIAGGFSLSGALSPFSCPALTPVTGTACLAPALGGTSTANPVMTNAYCACDHAGSPCVCTCRSPAPDTAPTWLCLP